MRASQTFISTLKEAPADAEVVSHQLMIRAGLIKRLGSGIYNYMPLGLRIIKKIEAIIREEMVRAGGIELLMPVVQPAELWMESGRFQKYGDELLRVKDRHHRDFVIQPTSEEVITDIARQELKSYRQLPKNFFHIQTKFRDERRPRFGLMRGREFTMKDAYSFDRDESSALVNYERMFNAYIAIFDRFGLKYKAVVADTGAIGGSRSHEFQVLAATGEDQIVFCEESGYASNIELAASALPTNLRAAPNCALQRVLTKGLATCEEVATLLSVPVTCTVKAIVLVPTHQGAEGKSAATRLVLILLRGDHSLNEVKVGKLRGFEAGFRFASKDEIESMFRTPPGYLGPVGVDSGIKVVADRAVSVMADFVCGANERDYHLTGVNWGRDLPEPAEVADVRNVVAGDLSPDGAGKVDILRGIEVGHVFFLGTRYSKAMNAQFLNEVGKPTYFEMGCYGIGVTRILGAAIEQNSDSRGIIWPLAIAPFSVVLCPIGIDRSIVVKDQAEDLYAKLVALGVDVILDDRGGRPGTMLADWELIGVPLRVVLSERSISEGTGEIQSRRQVAATKVPLAGLVQGVLNSLGSLSTGVSV
jgi:prolyl-tRNA synthetase